MAMTMNDYTQILINSLKVVGKEFLERPEKYINPNSEYTSEVDIWISFPSALDDSYRVPTIKVEHEMYPNMENVWAEIKEETDGSSIS